MLGEGNIRFSLNRVPNCVDPAKAAAGARKPARQRPAASASPSTTREYSGPNGVLAERIGVAGSYSPATRPEIYYHDLPPGFYRLVVNLAQNNGTITAFHAVTNFQILSAARPRRKPRRPGQCKPREGSSQRQGRFEQGAGTDSASRR